MVKKEIGKRMSKRWHEGGTDGDRRGSRQQSPQNEGLKVHHNVFQEAFLQAGPYRMMVCWACWWCHWQCRLVWSEDLNIKPHTAASMHSIVHGNYTHGQATSCCNRRNSGPARRTSGRLTFTFASERERPDKGVCVKSPRQSSHAVRHWKASRCHPLDKSEVM